VNVGVEVHHLAYAVQTLALHNLGAGRREEALVVGRILAIKIIGDNGVEYGIAQVFEPLVVLPTAVGHAHRFRTMHKSQLIQVDVVRVQAGNLVYVNIKLLILAEKELY
jgi:hypothetical protein